MKLRITIFGGAYTFDVAVLGLTVVAMLLVWWAYRKWRGRGYATTLAGVTVFAGALWLLYVNFTGVIIGRIRTPRLFIFCSDGVGKCRETYFRNADPFAFWLTAGFWTLLGIAAIAASALVLYKLWRARQRPPHAAQEQIRRNRWWLPAMICVVVLLTLLFAAEREAERQGNGWGGEAQREPLKLRVDPGAGR